MLPTLISVQIVHDEGELWQRKGTCTGEEGDRMAEVGGGGARSRHLVLRGRGAGPRRVP